MKIDASLMIQKENYRRQLAEMQKAYWEASRKVREAENEVLMDMFTKVLNSEEGMTAKEVVAKMGHVMSWQQACSHLSMASSASRTRCRIDREPTRKLRDSDNLDSRTQIKTKRFVEVDDFGMVKPGGEIVTKTTATTVYFAKKS